MFGFYPVNLRLEGRKCLVVGGGKVAERKVVNLLSYGAKVTVISPRITSKLAGQEGIELWLRSYQSKDVEGFFLVICATDDDAVNLQVASECMERNILVNVVDDPPKCTFLVPSVLRRGDLTISVSTGGKSPLLARKIRQSLEGLFGPEYAEYLEVLGEVRNRVIKNIPDINERKRMFTELIESDILEFIRLGNQEKVKERIEDVFVNRRS